MRPGKCTRETGATRQKVAFSAQLSKDHFENMRGRKCLHGIAHRRRADMESCASRWFSLAFRVGGCHCYPEGFSSFRSARNTFLQGCGGSKDDSPNKDPKAPASKSSIADDLETEDLDGDEFSKSNNNR